MKRELAAIREHAESAKSRLEMLGFGNQVFGNEIKSDDLAEVVQRDINEILTRLVYLEAL